MRNMLVLVIGRIELMIMTENHAVDMRVSPRKGLKSIRVMRGVSTTVRKMMLRMPVQCV